MKRLPTISLCMASVLAAMFALAGPAYASAAGQIKGSVVDQDGIPVPGALLTLSSPQLIGGFAQTNSDDDGTFIFAELPPGEYKLKSQFVGMGDVTKTGIIVQIGRTTTVTMEMKVGAATVEVKDTRKTVDTESVSSGTTMNSDFLARIPTGRDYLGALDSAAGVVGDGNANAGGASSVENTWLVDGINVSDPVTGTFSMNFNYDAIQEIQVITGGYDPEYGESLGAVFSVVTKSGGNTLEVIANGFYLNGNWGPKMDARFSADGYQIAPTGFDESAQTAQVGVTVSGPIVKDKVWFIGSYQYDRTLYANVGIPLPRDYDGGNFFSKLTMQPSSKHRISLQFSADPATIDNTNQSSSFVKPEAQGRQAQTGFVSSAKWNWFINPDTNLDTSVSYQKLSLEVNGVPCTHIAKLGYNPCDPGEAENTIDFTTPGRSGINGAYDSGSYGFFYFDDRKSLEGYSKLSLLQVDGFGKHDIKAGVDARWMWWDQIQGYASNLTYYDQYLDPFDPNTLQNYYWVEFSGAYQYSASGFHFGSFIQDVYKPVENLTFRYGIRYDRAVIRNDADEPVIDVGLFGPRVYASWDPFNTEKTKVYGGYGRFNDTGRMSVASYLSQGDLGHKLVLGEAFGSDYNNSSAANVYYDVPPKNFITVWDNIIAPHSDEFKIGTQRELIPDLAATVEFTGKFTRNVYSFDEVNFIYDEDGYSYIGTGTGTYNSLYRLRTPEIALRDYYQTDFKLLREEHKRWYLQAVYSYVVSRGRVQTPGNASSLSNPSQVELTYGNLGTDIRHQVKAQGYWKVPDDPWSTDIGFSAQYYSGSPFSRYYYAPLGPSGGGGYQLLKDQLGTYGRQPAYWQLNLLVQQAIDVKKGQLHATAELDNVTNNRYAIVYDTYYVSDQNRYIIAYRQDPITAQLGLVYEF